MCPKEMGFCCVGLHQKLKWPYRPTKILFYWPLGAAMLISFLLAMASLPWALLLGGRQQAPEEDELDTDQAGSRA